MALYESVVILDPTLNDEQATEQVEDIKRRIGQDTGCEVVAVSHWGRRKLAYPIKKHKEANYVVYRFTRPDEGGKVSFEELERHLRFAEQVMRHSIIRLPDTLKDSAILKPEEYRPRTPYHGPQSSAVPQAPAAAQPAQALVAAPASEAPVAAAEGGAVPEAAPAVGEAAAPETAAPEAAAKDATKDIAESKAE